MAGEVEETWKPTTLPLQKGSMPIDDLTAYQINAEFLLKIPIWFARKFQVLVATHQGQNQLIVVDEAGALQRDLLERMMRRPLGVVQASAAEMERTINRAYQSINSQSQEQIESLDEGTTVSDLLASKEDLLDGRKQAPVIRLVNSILSDAVKAGASDVHIQPYETQVVVRFRIDGYLVDQFTIPKSAQDEISSRIKILGKMDIAEKRLPQDGRASVRIGDRVVDLRIASLPTNFGERVVIRLLDKSTKLFSLPELGMPPDVLKQFAGLISQEHGIVLVTGPTGSGKSTTLYAALQRLDSKTKNVLTLEDPIEYELEGISQTQINMKKGMTFARGLRNILRQDPDVIMVGEIRDHETAEMAIQAALTGHLVFSTLHTNDAASAVTRLLDLGIEPFLISSSVLGVLAQRLVRQTCQDCLGEGCLHCQKLGYRGRIGLFELLVVSEEIREKIQGQANASEIKQVAKMQGMIDLRADGMDKIQRKLTTKEEVLRVSESDSSSVAW